MDHLESQFQAHKKLADGNKLDRFFSNPFKYILAIGYNQFFYRFFQKALVVESKLFFGKKMKLALPAGTDIFLTGGKSHDSEIRLSTFLMKTLKPGSTFIDIGAHFGFFTLLARHIVDSNGKVFAFEASGKTYEILKSNVASYENIDTYNIAVSDNTDDLIMYQFPPLYSEYNTSDIHQFDKQSWLQNVKPEVVLIKAITLDDIIFKQAVSPDVIKIDVEGAELNVLKGGHKFLQQNKKAVIVMEYLCPDRNNINHRKAIELMINLGYSIFIITPQGELHSISDIDGYLKSNNFESDNIVFNRSKDNN